LLQLLEDSVKQGLGWRIHESVEDTKLSTNKQHTLSHLIDAETLVLKSSIKRRESEAAFAPAAIGSYIGYAGR